MSSEDKLIIGPLEKQHDRKSFLCGASALDSYFQRQASQDVKRKISRIFVATKEDQPHTIVGFYTLSALSIEAEDLPDYIARKLPKHPLPTALIGRLAVDQNIQGEGIGRMLLMDALKRTFLASETILFMPSSWTQKTTELCLFMRVLVLKRLQDQNVCSYPYQN